MKLNKRDLWYALGFILCFLVFFGEVIFTKATFCYRDILRYYHPVHFFATESVQKGYIPYWNPYVFCGYPFLATVQHALFYPFSMLHYLFPFDGGFKFFFLIHYFLAGGGIYLLLRKIGLVPVSCFIGGIIFTFNGYLLSLTNLLTTLTAVCWMSVCLLLFMHGMRRFWYWMVLVAFVLAGQFYSGQPEMMFLSGVLLVGYSVYAWQERIVSLKVIGWKLGLTFFLSALFILPEALLFKEFLDLSVRAKGVDFGQVSYWSFHPLELVAMIIHTFSWDFLQTDTWFRQTWLRSFYFGIIPLFFVGLSFAHREKRRLVYFFGLVGLVGLVLAFGKYTPLFEMFYRFLPGFNLIRYPVKYIIFLDVALVCLAAIGLEVWLNPEKKRVVQRWLVVWAIMAVVGLVTLYVLQNVFIQWLAQRYLPNSFPENIKMLRTQYLPAVFKESGWTAVFLALLIGLWCARNRLPKKISLLLLSILLVFNVISVNIASEPLVKSDFYRYRAPIVEFLSSRLGYDRFHFEIKYSKDSSFADLIAYKLPFFPDLNMAFHLFDIGIYESLDLGKKENALRILGTQPGYTTTPLANMLGLRYLFTQRTITEPGLRHIGMMKTFRIYENTQVLPRVKLYDRVIAATTHDDLTKVNFILSKRFQSEKELFIADGKQEYGDRGDSHSAARGSAAIISYLANEVTVMVDADNPAWLALFDCEYPDWTVTINGKRSEIYEANYFFRATKVPSGKSLVKFKYIPVKYYWGLIILISFLIALSIGVGCGLKKCKGGERA